MMSQSIFYVSFFPFNPFLFYFFLNNTEKRYIPPYRNTHVDTRNIISFLLLHRFILISSTISISGYNANAESLGIVSG